MPNKDKAYHSSLIVRLPNWVGDGVMAMPALNALKQAGFALHLYGPRFGEDLFQSFGASYQVLPEAFYPSVRMYARSNVRNMLVFPNSFSSVAQGYLAGKRCLGYLTDYRSYFLAHGYPKPQGGHESLVFYKLARLASETWLPEACFRAEMTQTVIWSPSAQTLSDIDLKLSLNDITTPFVVISPLAKGLTKTGASKIWPNWKGLVKRLSDKGLQLVCAPAQDESALLQTQFPEVKALLGLNLTELGALFYRARLTVSNDTGPMHLAAAVGGKVLGIFGETDPERFKPIGGEYAGKKEAWPTVDEVAEKVLRYF